MKPLSILSALAATLLLVQPASLQAGGHAEVAPAPTKDIVDTAVSAGTFKTLVAAVQAADLVATLKSEGPFTVFAPADSAFAKLPAGAVEGLLKDKAQLTGVLTLHVVSGRHDAASVAASQWMQTVNGQSIRVQSDKSGVRVGSARVVKADIKTSNGLIHVIDTVLMPKPDIVDTAVAAGSFQTLVTAVKAADLVKTLKGKGPFTVFAPSDAAFAKIPADTLGAVLKDKAKLSSILTYHVVPGRILSTDIRMGTVEVKTAQGSMLKVTKTDDGRVMVNGVAAVSAADIVAGNGVIHVIDTVVMPK